MKKFCFMLIVLLIPVLVFTGCNHPFSPGTVENGVYTNSYAGFGCRLEENWICSDTDPFDLLLEKESIQSGIRITHTRLSAAEYIRCQFQSEEQKLDSILAQKEQIIQHYKTEGIAISSLNAESVTFLGEERRALRCEAAMDGIPYYLLQLHNFDAGAYGITLTVFSFYQDHTPEILDLFYPVSK